MKNFFTRFSAAVCFLFVSNGYSTDLSDVEHEAVTIWSGGIRLQGDIFKPAEIPAGEKLPGILLVHGWGGYKQHLNRNYAPQFAKLGFVVITFDYKGWGESNGRLLSTEPLDKTDEFLARVNVDVTHVRKIVNPLSMVEDARAALNYLAGEKQVAANNIGIWGTSLGGGVALVTAANDDRIKAYVDQIGAVNFKANLQMINRDMVRRWQVQRARGVIPPYPEADAIINPQLKGYPDWIAMKAFDSLAEAEKLAVPTLIIDAEDEELFAREKNGKVLYEKIKNRVATKYVVYPGKHYDIYRDEAYQGALRDAQQWFVEHLKGSDVGANLYKASCASCHSNPQIKAPALGSLRSLSYDKVLHEITSGNMQQQAAHLTTGEHQQLAKYLSAESKNPRAWEIPMACTNTQAVSVTKTPVANWGYGLRNHRYQNSEQAGLSAEDLNTLEVAWVQGFPGTTEMRSQPVISDNTLFLAVDSTQSVYAFDLAQGCLQWVYRVGAPPRSALSLSRLSNSDKPVIYFGDSGANVHVVDAISGERIWKKNVEISSANIITGTPVLHNDRIYVPLSTFEVGRAGRATYECCKEHGGLQALDANSGEVIWTYETTGEAKIVGKNSLGVNSWGPSGAPVWTTPAIDEKRNRIYIGTGENYSHPTTTTSDAIVAIDMDSGKSVWVYQATENDAYNMACTAYLGYPNQVNCPQQEGPDFDFGASVIIAKNSAGKDILLAGQKSGDVYALDPDNNGKVLWNTKLSDGTPVGGIHWGMSLVGDTLFVPIADPDWDIKTWDYQPKPGIAALNVDDGEIKWRHMAIRGCELDPGTVDLANGRHSEQWPECHFLYGYSGAATAIDGAVLAGSLNGKLTAFSSNSGKPIWEFDTKKSFAALNGVAAYGGSMDNAGPAVGSGYMVLQSGYSYINQMPGNVLMVLKNLNNNRDDTFQEGAVLSLWQP